MPQRKPAAPNPATPSGDSPTSTPPETNTTVQPNGKPGTDTITAPAAVSRIRRWVRARRSDAATYVLRGACYGIGTGVCALVVWWIEHHS